MGRGGLEEVVERRWAAVSHCTGERLMRALAIALLMLTPAPADALTNCSGTVTTAATAVTPIPAGTPYKGFLLANLNTTEALWWAPAATAVAATAGSLPLAAPTATTFVDAGMFVSPPNFGTNIAISIVAATAGHAFSCYWW
jgi:hypothetical protein